ncbi:MAG TPA: hypothetical protein VKP14_10360 [Gaiellaceae bacterium]|nr:hypothetical protein [Gaiellaceae bacterium]
MPDAPGPNVPFPPMEAELVSELPVGDGWRYEPKWDGFRGVLENDGGELALWSRNGRPLLRYFPELREVGDLLPPHSALDGEIVISRGGALDFDAMQMRLHPAESRVRKLSAEIPATFVAFDLLLWKGKAVHERPIEKRRAELEKVADGIELSPFSDDVEQGRDWLQTLQAAGFDGVIAKRLGLPYLPGSRDGVVKVKPHKTADCVVAGLRWKAGGRKTIATLLLGLYADDGSRLRRLVRGRGEEARRDRVARPPAARREERPSLLGAEPLGHERAGRGGAEAEARRRGALRQAREAPLPARHAPHPLPAGQGSRPVHVARGASGPKAGRPRSGRSPQVFLTSRTLESATHTISAMKATKPIPPVIEKNPLFLSATPPSTKSAAARSDSQAYQSGSALLRFVASHVASASAAAVHSRRP